MRSSQFSSAGFILGLLGAASGFVIPTRAGDKVIPQKFEGQGASDEPYCLPGRGIRDQEARGAIHHLAFKTVPRHGLTMPAGGCLHYINGDTLAQICNYSPKDLAVTQKEVFLALNQLRSDCGSKEFSGQMKRQLDGLSAYLYGVAPGIDQSHHVNGKRENVQEASLEDDVLTIKVDQPLESKEEYDELVADVLLKARNENTTNSNPCDVKYPNFPSKPILGCNAHPLDKDGRCPRPSRHYNKPTFCETQRRFLYGAEQQYDVEPILNGPGSPERELAVGTSVTYGVSYSANLGFTIPETTFNLGLDISLTHAITYTTTNAFTAKKSTMNGYCGYFTFIPKMIESCGSLTNWQSKPLKGDEPVEVLDSDQVVETHKDVKYGQTVKDVCVMHPFLKENGEADGITVIVLTDCTKQHILAPMSEQNIAYRYPGVAKISPVDHELPLEVDN
ncbi:hypothetical protein ABW21_db0207260 [Orbilia brochopaga]|nr:hypothetical protein ABW21_db0207260 [Drechslerella brochopaga]